MIYLASQSPRRRELMQMLGLELTICPADIDETMDPALPPAQEVARVSAAKAAAARAPEDALVVAADTIVVCAGEVLGKPHSPGDARRMLHLLSGAPHEVLTGLTVRQGSRSVTHVERTELRFRDLTDAEIEAYLATGESMDKAGAYGIQGKAALFVTGLNGDYYNVMGLPLCALGQMLAQFGVNVLGGAQ